MLSRVAIFTRSAAAIACLACSAVSALELPLPPAGEDVIGQVQVIKSKYEDTFADLGEANGIGYSAMVAANPGVDAWLPGVNKEIVLPTRFILPPGKREGIVINLAEYRLYYFPKGRDVVYTYPIGIGREGWGSPVATTKVVAKIPRPSWTPPASIRAEHAADGDPLPAVVKPGPDNPLGPFKFVLGLPGYLIHGSNKQFGVGMRTSHGCFRLYNDDVLALAEVVPVGTPVRIINQPYKFGVSSGKVYLEAHTPLDAEGDSGKVNRHAVLMDVLRKRQDVGKGIDLDWEMVRNVIGAEDGLPVEIAVPDVAAPSKPPDDL